MSKFPKNALTSYWVDGSSNSNNVYADANVVMVNMGYFSKDGTAKFQPSDGTNMRILINGWKNAGKTVLLSMGGAIVNPQWIDDAVNPQDWGHFSEGASHASHQEQFVASIGALLEEWGFDGLDFDVEGESLVNSTDAIAFNNFAAAVRTALPDRLICLTIPAKSVIFSDKVPYIGTPWVTGGAPYNTLVPMSQQGTFDSNFDLIQIMMYDMKGDPDRIYHRDRKSYDIHQPQYRAQIIYEYTNEREFNFEDWQHSSGSPRSGTNDSQWNKFPGIDSNKIAMGVRADKTGHGYLTPKQIKHTSITSEKVKNGMVWESNADFTNQDHAISKAVENVISEHT